MTQPAPNDLEHALVPEREIIPGEYHAEADQLALDLEALARDKGYDRDMMQSALDAGADLFLAGERDLGINTPEKCLNVLVTKYGETDAAKLIEQAQKQAQSMGPDGLARQYRPGQFTSGHQRPGCRVPGDLQMNADAAANLVKELRSGPNANDKAVVDRVRILTRIANPTGASKPESTYYGVSPSGYAVSPLSPLTTGREAQSLEAQLNEINLNPDLYSSDATKRKPLIARRARLQAAIAAKKQSK